MAWKYELTPAQVEKLLAWSAEQDATVVGRQRASRGPLLKKLAKEGIPYYGASGGALSITLTPTSIGLAVTATHAITLCELDLTDYDNW